MRDVVASQGPKSLEACRSVPPVPTAATHAAHFRGKHLYMSLELRDFSISPTRSSHIEAFLKNKVVEQIVHGAFCTAIECPLGASSIVILATRVRCTATFGNAKMT